MRYEQPEDDKFFQARGVKPPERTPHLTDDEIEERFEENRQQRHCEWRQRGPEVYCISCTNQHGIFVGTQQLLAGTDRRGLPILQPVVLSKV